jgi:hypothetical protein
MKGRSPYREVTSIYIDKESYQIQFSDNQCKIRYKYLYPGVLPEQYLERKYQVFKDYFGNL